MQNNSSVLYRPVVAEIAPLKQVPESESVSATIRRRRRALEEYE
jgi:hypothetical protein